MTQCISLARDIYLLTVLDATRVDSTECNELVRYTFDVTQRRFFSTVYNIEIFFLIRFSYTERTYFEKFKN